MEYRSRFLHAVHGEMLNKTESTRYLGISRKRFQRIAPPPDYIQNGVYPFWAKRVLDILPLEDDFNQEEILKTGRACGNYLIGEMNDEEVRELQRALTGVLTGSPSPEDHTASVLKVYGINVRFRSRYEANAYRDGVLSAVKHYVL